MRNLLFLIILLPLYSFAQNEVAYTSLAKKQREKSGSLSGAG